MNDKLVTTGLVVREVPSKDSNSLLTILTPADGLVTATAYGARKTGATLASGTKLFNYSEFSLVESRGRYKVDHVRSIEQFFDLSRSVEGLAAASYFMQVLYDISVTGEPEVSNLRLSLNSLYALTKGKHRIEKIKAVFELRLMSQAGFEPELMGCGSCGEGKCAYFSAADACLYCEKCAEPRLRAGEGLMRVCPDAQDAMRYIVSADMQRIFSFTLSDEGLYNLAAVCEAYTRIQTEKSYDSLDIYHSLMESYR